MKVVVLGSGGMLGKAICRELEDSHIEYDGLDHSKFDVTTGDISKIKADCLINCAGIIPLKKASVKETIAVNAFAPIEIVSKFSGHVILVSTDCVFSGNLPLGQSYTISDIPDSKDLYGMTKILGEIKTSNATIVRTSFIGNDHGLMKWVMDNNCKQVNGYKYSMWSGSIVEEVSMHIVCIAKQSKPLGLVHLSTRQPISKLDLINLIVKRLGLSIIVNPAETPIINRVLKPTIELKSIWTAM